MTGVGALLVRLRESRRRPRWETRPHDDFAQSLDKEAFWVPPDGFVKILDELGCQV